MAIIYGFFNIKSQQRKEEKWKAEGAHQPIYTHSGMHEKQKYQQKREERKVVVVVVVN